MKTFKEYINEVKKPTGDLKKACWDGYTAVGMKMKGGRKVPNCVPEEIEQLAEYGDTAKGQKMLSKVQKRAVDRVVSKKADTDPKYAKKNQDTANAAYERMKEEVELDESSSPNTPALSSYTNKLGGNGSAHDFVTKFGAKEAKQHRDALHKERESIGTSHGYKHHQAHDRIIRGLDNMLKGVKEDVELDETAAWQRKEGKRESGGLNQKGVDSYRREHPGSKLKTAVTTKPSKLKPGSAAANRRKSFCARMSGMKKRLTSAKTAHDPDSRINKSLRKWNC